MATEIKTWEIIEGKLKSVESSLANNNRKEKEHLEEWIKTNPSILGDNIQIIGQQVRTKSGPLDYLGIDSKGNTVIIELKRERLPREVIAQAIDYASDVASWEIDKLSEICLQQTGQNLEDLITETFENIDLEDLTINLNQRILLVGFGIEESLNRMIDWLSSKYDISINAVILQYSLTSSGNELLSRTVIIPEEVVNEKSNKKKFSIPMSDEPGEYESGKLKELLTQYLTRKLHSSRRLRDVVLPVLLKYPSRTRDELKKDFVISGEAQNESQAGSFLSLISGQLGQEKKDYLRQIIKYSYPNYHWEKDNFSIRSEYRELVENVLNQLGSSGEAENEVFSEAK
ncbi:endonuclease NucS domain-containing protein [Salinimicrobium sp. CAU 1759]